MPQIGEIKMAQDIGHTGRGRILFIFAECEDCHIQRWVRLLAGKPRNKICHHCASLRGAKVPRTWMVGKLNHRYKNGKYKTKSGYIMARVLVGDFFRSMAQRDGLICEHRLVMAKYLNRCLLPWEVVHHKNGIKDDNRLENLQLLTATKHLVDTEMKAQLTRLEKENRRLKELLLIHIKPNTGEVTVEG